MGTKGFLIPNPFKLPLQILVLFQLFLKDSCVEGTRDICYETFPIFFVHHYNDRLVSGVCLSTVKSVYAFKSHKFLQPKKTRASQHTLIWILLGTCQKLAGTGGGEL